MTYSAEKKGELAKTMVGALDYETLVENYIHYLNLDWDSNPEQLEADWQWYMIDRKWAEELVQRRK